MIRIVWIAALCCVLCLVLYVPSAFSPDQLMQTVRAEHDINSRLWGDAAADKILERMLDFQAAGGSVSTPPAATVQVAGPGVNTAMAAEVGQMSMRLFASPYFKSVDALFGLAAYRASALLHVLPLLLVFMVICGVDGFAVRSVRAREFVAHSAEVFTASATVGIALLALVLVGIFLPFTLSPLYTIGALLLMLFVLSRAIANYHLIH
ncbi:MAG: DUF4400 domain-containing protein [Polyangiaceae bacterium]|jgi:hypothetical protein|nr:DUF4400 domain-containing protein [Burkholderiaceae bacterium]